MYFVDRNKIEAILQYLEEIIPLIQQETEITGLENRLMLERAAHVLCESVIDVGNQMIDGFIMRDPGSYEDILDILADESVIRETEAERLKPLIRLRKPLVQHYYELEQTMLHEALTIAGPALERFPEDIRTYLNEELGPVSAFMPDDH